MLPVSWRSELVATSVLAWPLILGGLTQVVMGTVGVMMIGRLGPDAVAASSLATSFLCLAIPVGFGLGAAVSAMVAIALGRGLHRIRETRRTARQAFWIVVLSVIPVWFGMSYAENFFLAIGQQPLLAVMAADYVQVSLWGMLPLWGFLVLRSLCTTLGYPLVSMVVTAVAIPLNAALNWILIYGNAGCEPLGIRGAALATVTVDILMCLALLLYVLLHPRLRRFGLFVEIWRHDWSRFFELLRFAVPVVAAYGLEFCAFTTATFMMGLVGPLELAAHAIVINAITVLYMVPVGLSQAATVRVGLARGALNTAAITRAGWVPLSMGMAFMALCAACVVLFPDVIVALFMGKNTRGSEQVLGLATAYLQICALFQIFDGIQSVSSGVLRGLKDATVPMICMGTGFWVLGLPLAALMAFPLGLGGAGIWYGLAIGLGCVALMLMVRWIRRDRWAMLPAR
ncbi:MATE family efflux transporter [Haematospirillum sp. 15-248]|uniref:MATE family efflux transporter n=1 Tax=Haematospirillum sp. 15-248 TaxID=2723107 RepID=UPI00143A7D52|nr:MATE family efflux transporter [Haematospirillum sp. 15-248]NKD87806.1 MATE family efflux transporter [Haematospirillum sp. 15-248]